MNIIEEMPLVLLLAIVGPAAAAAVWLVFRPSAPRHADVAYRVRHPAAPELFVWMAGERLPDESFGRPLSVMPGIAGDVAVLTVQFSSTHPGMSKKEAEDLADFVGGWVEPVVVR